MPALVACAFLVLNVDGLLAESAASAGESAVASQAASPKPWDWEDQCRWWLSGDDGKMLLASIGPGDEGMVLSLADPAFLEWPEEARPRVELVFDGDRYRRVVVEGWSSHIGTETAIFGAELDAKGIRMLSGATSLAVRRKGRTFFQLQLAATPGEADLAACVPPPESDSPDRE